MTCRDGYSGIPKMNQGAGKFIHGLGGVHLDERGNWDFQAIQGAWPSQKFSQKAARGKDQKVSLPEVQVQGQNLD